jgi:hypothetical protein
MVATSRAAFKQRCLENLGAPVIRINVADRQVENRIDQALLFWRDWHYDATERTFIPIQIRAEDITNRWVPVPDEVVGVYAVVHIGTTQGITNNLLSLNYQMRVSLLDLFNMFDRSMIPYYMAMAHIAFLDQFLSPQPHWEYNRWGDKLYLQTRWDRLTVGEYIVIDARKPVNTVQIWQDLWLERYTTALIKLQWGNNLSKYTGTTLIGNVQMDGQKIKDEATQEITELETQLKQNLSEPLGIFIG